MLSRTTVAGILLALLSLCSRSAGACTCIIPGPSRALQEADAVFTGKVVDVNDGTGTALLEVYTSWKGIPAWKNEIEMRFSGPCLYDLKLGQEYLLYADMGADQKLVTSMCYPNRLLAKAGKDLRELERRRRRAWHQRK